MKHITLLLLTTLLWISNISAQTNCSSRSPRIFNVLLNILHLPNEAISESVKIVKGVEKCGTSGRSPGSDPNRTSTSLLYHTYMVDQTALNKGFYIATTAKMTIGMLNSSIAFAKSIIPLYLISFGSEMRNSRMWLHWKPSAEINDFAFYGKGIAKGRGDNTYTFTCDTLIQGLYYFRLKMIDNNGNFTYSKIIRSLILPENEPLISIPSSPVADILIVYVDMAKAIDIYNTQGDKMLI